MYSMVLNTIGMAANTNGLVLDTVARFSSDLSFAWFDMHGALGMPQGRRRHAALVACTRAGDGPEFC